MRDEKPLPIVLLSLLLAAFYVAGMLHVLLLCLLCALLHEGAHLLALKRCKGRVLALRAGLYGARIDYGHRALCSYRDEMLISLAGPGLNLLLGLLCYALHRLEPTNALFSYLCGINLVLCFFNLLPLWCLDGGKALLAFLLQHGDFERAHRLLHILSVLSCLLLLLGGLLVLFLSGYNPSLLICALYLSGKTFSGTCIHKKGLKCALALG